VLDAGPHRRGDGRRFTVDYALAGLDLLLHRAGWSVQVPARQAAERDEAAIAAWKEETWPAVKGRRRTWAPGCVSRTNPARAEGRQRAAPGAAAATPRW
jgi:Winged helix-turn helix